jgi:hypothetical protein
MVDIIAPAMRQINLQDGPDQSKMDGTPSGTIIGPSFLLTTPDAKPPKPSPLLTPSPQLYIVAQH